MPDRYYVRLTRQALDDIEEIKDFIGQSSQKNAAKMIERLFDAFDSLEQFPRRTVVEHYPIGSSIQFESFR